MSGLDNRNFRQGALSNRAVVALKKSSGVLSYEASGIRENIALNDLPVSALEVIVEALEALAKSKKVGA